MYSGYLVCGFLLIISVVYVSDAFFNHLGRDGNDLGSTSYIYQYVTCIRSDAENKKYSALTFTSTKAMMSGLLIMMGKYG